MELDCLYAIEQDEHVAELRRIQLGVSAAWGEKANQSLTRHINESNKLKNEHLLR